MASPSAINTRVPRLELRAKLMMGESAIQDLTECVITEPDTVTKSSVTLPKKTAIIQTLAPRPLIRQQT